MMQRKIIYTALFAILFQLVGTTVNAQTTIKKWSFQTNGKIESSIQVSNDTLFVGSLDSTFYAVDTLGELIWKVKVPYQIKSTASFYGKTVCFEAGNRLYALNKATGAEKWKHEPDEVIGESITQTYDPWDLKGPSPFINDSVFYYGNELGSVYGINAKTGEEVFHYNTGNGFAIRVKPITASDTLYFADFDGEVYAVNINAEALLWSYNSYSGNKPYPDFGPVIGDMVAYGDNLYFGIRNHEFQVLNRKTGEQAWTYNSGGTWLSGIPLIINDTLYLGTSDTQLLLAFDANTGDFIWRNDVGLGVYNSPAVYKNLLVVTGGDEQMPNEFGEGVVKLIAKNGDMINAVGLHASCFNTPLVRKNDLYFGTYSGEILCFDLLALTTNLKDSVSTDITAFNGGTYTEEANISEELGYIRNLGNDTIQLSISTEDETLPEGSVYASMKRTINIQDSTLVKLRIKSFMLENGDYQTNILVNIPENPALNFKIPISFSVDINTSSSQDILEDSQVKVYPNPVSETATIILNVSESGQGSIAFYDVSGKLLESIPVDISSAGAHTYRWNATASSMAYYKVIFNDKQIDSGTLIIH